ncbi:YdaS family helix-turn-helix protein [Rhizobium ecuadorense]|uniref:YdaS family helix-turn-helix protein n=1 Tax=Rhizobium ecuadorense TaxID=1671795 RepID=UPI000673B106|nr:YdaS family helix-turn-helix protein [Rhizobium ecuadorense]
MIYFIECSGRVKVGFSEDPWRRVSKVAADSPFPCTLIGVMSGDRSVETHVQKQWKHLHCHREWFAASKEFLVWISDNALIRKEKTLPKSGDERKPHNEMCGLIVKRGEKIKIARECGVTPAAVAQWLKVPAEYCAIVSNITGHDRQVLRPDIFSSTSASIQ